MNDDRALAGLGSRLVAKILDNLLVIGVFVPGVVLMFAFGGPDVIEQQYPAVQVLIVLITLVLLLVVGIGQMVLLATRGQTVGKIVVGVEIVRLDGSEPGFVHAVILRNWVIGFAVGVLNQCCMGWIVVLIDVIPIFGEERRCLHDLIADTKVVQRW